MALAVVVAIGFLSSIGYLIFSGDSSTPEEEELALQEQLALQNALLEQQQEEQTQAISTASFGSDVSDSDEDDTEPGEVENLRDTARDTTWIFWDWDNPDDDDFDKNLIYIDGTKVATTSSSYYNATGLNPGVSYTIEVKTRDFDGNINEDGMTDTATTLGSGTNGTINATSATSISNLAFTRDLNSIHWTWINPTGPGFTSNILVVDGVNIANTTSTNYDLTSLGQNTAHTISITTNLNATAVISTVTTCYEVEWFERYTICP